MAGCSPWDLKELDTTEQLTLSFTYERWGHEGGAYMMGLVSS